MDIEEQVDLVLDALEEFATKECPYCNLGVGPDVSYDDIRRWLKKRKEAIPTPK